MRQSNILNKKKNCCRRKNTLMMKIVTKGVGKNSCILILNFFRKYSKTVNKNCMTIRIFAYDHIWKYK